MNFNQLADKTSYFKRTKEGEQAMCKMMEDMRRETAEKAAREMKIQTVKEMIEAGIVSFSAVKASSLYTDQKLVAIAAN